MFYAYPGHDFHEVGSTIHFVQAVSLIFSAAARASDLSNKCILDQFDHVDCKREIATLQAIAYTRQGFIWVRHDMDPNGLTG